MEPATGIVEAQPEFVSSSLGKELSNENLEKLCVAHIVIEK